MSTMIPNELKFDLDLNDLPARATQLASEALSLSAGGIAYVDTHLKYDDPFFGMASITTVCRAQCRYAYGDKYNTVTFLNLHSPDNYDGTVMCACAYG